MKGYCASLVGEATLYSTTQIPKDYEDVELSPDGLTGWMKISTRNKAKDKYNPGSRLLTFWLTPKLRLKLHSKEEVNYFKKILDDNNGNEKLAVFKFKEESSKQTNI